MRRFNVAPMILAAAVASAGYAPHPVSLRGHPAAAVNTVFVLALENQNWSTIKGNPDATYINHTLLPMASYATQYYNPPNIHPSLPNYLWLEAGTNFGVTDDGDPSAHIIHAKYHLVTLLDSARISWKAYEENITGASCPLTSSYPYAAKHNPFVYFANVRDRPSYCIAHERPYSQLAADLRRNTVARYNFITPNLCHDMHDSCTPTNDAIRQGDAWLSRQVPTILRSRAYRHGGALFIVWDEGEGNDGPIGAIVLSPSAKGHGYHNAKHYTHSSLLRTIEEIFRVHPLLGGAKNAPDLRDLFRRFP